MATLLAQVKQERDPIDTSARDSDGLAALEDKIRRTVELLRHEREARHAAEAEVARLSESTMSERKLLADLQRELDSLRMDRTEVKARVERLLTQLDELAQA